MIEPKGKLTPIRLVHQGDPHEHVTYVTVVCVDEVGALWCFNASSFNHNMKPFPLAGNENGTAITGRVSGMSHGEQ